MRPCFPGPLSPEIVDRNSIEFPDVKAVREEWLSDRIPREIEVSYAKVADILRVETGDVVRKQLELRVEDGAEVEVSSRDVVERAVDNVERDTLERNVFDDVLLCTVENDPRTLTCK